MANVTKPEKCTSYVKSGSQCWCKVGSKYEGTVGMGYCTRGVTKRAKLDYSLRKLWR
jgi:hypothetical protein